MGSPDDSFISNPIYSDEYLIVLDKPVDLPVHKNDFMANDAPYLTKMVGDYFGKWIYNVHRLDAKTSGLIILAFSNRVAHELTKQFERKEVSKIYYAITRENPGEGEFNQKVLVKKKSNFKKDALTRYKTLRTIETGISYKGNENVKLSLVEIRPETGRWHQIRQHFAKNRFDLIGDIYHGDFALNKIILAKTGLRRLFLHAGHLKLTHPVTKEQIEFTSKPPFEFKIVLDFLKIP